MKLESTLKTDSSGVDYFAPCKNAYDMRELKDEEIGRLLQAVAQLKEYEAIIVDVSGDLDGTEAVAHAGIRRSDHLYL